MLGSVVLLYALVFVIFYFFQDKFVFQAKSLPTKYAFSFNHEFEEFFIPTGNGDTLNALLFRTKQEPKGLILFFHGNAGSLKRWGEYAVDFTSLGCDILMVDYRGYGKSTGKPNEENLYQDARTILNWTKANLTYSKLILYGRSLGSAIATNLATQSNPDLLILETPFDKLSSLLYSLPSRYSFPNNTMIPEVKCRKIIIHGTEDGVVPLASALRLKPLLGKSDQFVIIEGGSHNNLHEFEKYHKTLKEALE